MSEPTGARRYGVGGGDAYYDAVRYGGYEGTREQFGKDQAEFAQNAAVVAEAKETVERDTEEVRNTKNTFENTTVPEAIRALEQESEDQILAITQKGEEVSQQVETVGTEQKDAVANEGRARVRAIEQAGTDQVQAVNDAGTTQVGNVNQAGEDQVDAVEQAGADQVQAVIDEGGIQVQRVQDKGDEVLESIPADYIVLDQKVDDMLLQGNLINRNTLEYNKEFAAANDGTTQNSTTFFITDYIAVREGETLYKRGTFSKCAAYNASKQFISIVTITNPYVVPAGIAFLRIGIFYNNFENCVLSRNNALVSDYGAYPSIGISGINIDKESAENRNKNTPRRNTLFVASFTGANCNVVKNFEFVLDAPFSILAVNEITGALDLRINVDEYNPFGVTAVDFFIYIPDVSKTNTITCMYASGTFSFQNSSLKNGWNTLRAYTYTGNHPQSSAQTTLRITSAGTAGNKLYFAKAVTYSAEKANMILVQDGGYSTFLELAYPTLKDMLVPVTWALNPGRLGEDVGNAGRIFTQAQIDSLADDGNSEFSFHCWNATEKATESMTAEEIQDDVAKCLHYLRSNGICPAHVWRAAHAQNTAPNYQAEIGMVEALATATSSSAATTFPFTDRWNIPRVAIHNRSTADIDEMFLKMKDFHCTYVFYTHGIHNSTYNMSPELFEYFCGKVQTGITEGWLRPTTYSRLVDTPESWVT